MIALQEELDWRCYTLYGITDQDLCYRDDSGNQLDPPAIALGQRAFEIIMARKIAAGELETTWFERHRSTPITELPSHWPDDYRRLVERRMALIESNQYINLIERPEYKRRWNTEPWEAQEKRALRSWLLDRLEDERYWSEPQFQTTRTLADRVQFDGEWMQVAELYRGYAGLMCRPSWPSWSRPRPCLFSPCCATRPPACASARSGSAPGSCSAARTPLTPMWLPH